MAAEEKRFNVGDKVTYKDWYVLPKGAYEYGGKNQKGYVGEITKYLNFNSEKDCWTIRVTSILDHNFIMLETEFEEYDSVLNEAKARYPRGTCFTPSHIKKVTSDYCIITEDSCMESIGNKIYSVIKPSIGNSGLYSGLYSDNSKHGNTGANRMIYSNADGWAKVQGNILRDPGSIRHLHGVNPCSEIELPDYLKYISPDSKEKPLIEPVHSVSVQLRTNKKSKKLTI